MSDKQATSKLEQLEALERAYKEHMEDYDVGLNMGRVVEFTDALLEAAPHLIRLADKVKIAKPAIEHAWQQAMAAGTAEGVTRAMSFYDVLDALEALTEQGGGD